MAAAGRSTAEAGPPRGVYELSMELAGLVEVVIEQVEARFHLKDALDRAALVVCVRVAQAAGETTKLERRRQYQHARRAATECATLLDLLGRKSPTSRPVKHAQVAAAHLVTQLATLGTR